MCRGHVLKALQSMACRDPCKGPLLVAVPHVLSALDRQCVTAACAARGLAFFVNVASSSEGLPSLVHVIPSTLRMTGTFLTTEPVGCSCILLSCMLPQ